MRYRERRGRSTRCEALVYIPDSFPTLAPLSGGVFAPHDLPCRRATPPADRRFSDRVARVRVARMTAAVLRRRSTRRAHRMHRSPAPTLAPAGRRHVARRDTGAGATRRRQQPPAEEGPGAAGRNGARPRSRSRRPPAGHDVGASSIDAEDDGDDDDGTLWWPWVARRTRRDRCRPSRPHPPAPPRTVLATPDDDAARRHRTTDEPSCGGHPGRPARRGPGRHDPAGDHASHAAGPDRIGARCQQPDDALAR